MKPKTENYCVFMCPPLENYPEPPKEHSESELWDCPSCKEKMWMSRKKKRYLMFCVALNKEIILRCYKCIIKEAPEILKDSGIKPISI